MKISKSKYIKHCGSELFIFEKDDAFSFLSKRFFIIFGKKGQVRGRHAHKKHKQYLICISGECEVIIDDGFIKKKIKLNDPKFGVEINPMIWSEQLYKKKNTKILVLCDQKFQEKDYIRKYSTFKKIISGKN